jgi:acetate---CoA ligase (ADP-forming)
MALSLASYSGPVALVNLRGADGMHKTVREAVAAAAGPVDLAVLCVPASACAQAIRDCAEAGVGAALICAGGFSEAGGPGVQAEAELVRAAAETGVRILGPNTSGFFVPPDGLVASFVPAAGALTAGNVAVVAASGGLNHALAFAFQRRGTGLSIGVGIGAGIDVTAAEILRYCAEDPRTWAIALHLETVADGPALLQAVRETSRRKPVVALVVGEHDLGDFARSHTGALATSWRTTRALLAQAGAVIVDDEQQLVTATSVLASTRARPTADPAAVLVTAQAGPGLVTTDALHSAGVRLPTLSNTTQSLLGELLPPLTYQANPVDTGRPGPQHHQVISAVAADEAIDLVGVYALAEPVVNLIEAVTSADLHGRACVVAVDGPEADVAAARGSGQKAEIAVVVGPTELADALDALAQDARHQYSLIAADLHSPAAPASVAPLRRTPTEDQAKALVDTLGIATPDRCICDSLESALEAFHRLGAPVAVKVSSADILHKSDLGGVVLNVSTDAELALAYEKIVAVAPEALVERMAGPGTDLIVGARRDPVFGPVVVVGIGGIATEVYSDVAIAATPVSPDRLVGLLRQLRGSSLFDGFRGTAPVPLTEVARIAETLGAFLACHPEVEEIEINPLRSTSEGLIALDAVVVVRPSTASEEEQR